MGFLSDLKERFAKMRRYLGATPIEGETYEKSPDIKDLPHMKDADGHLIAVSSGNRELSPVLSAKLNIQSSQGKHAQADSNNDHIDTQMTSTA